MPQAPSLHQTRLKHQALKPAGLFLPTDTSLPNPSLYQALQIDYDFLNLETSPTIILDCYDIEDGLLDSADDFLGRAVIHSNEASVLHSLNTYAKFLNYPPQPIWHDL